MAVNCGLCSNFANCKKSYEVTRCLSFDPITPTPFSIPRNKIFVTDPKEIKKINDSAKDIMDQAIKADDGKPHLSLVPTKIIFAIEKIRTYGNNKYPKGGKDNWKMVEPMRHYEASLRHTAKHWNDPFAIDPESRLPHYFHKVCDDAFFIELNWDKFMEAIEKHKEVNG